jgi:hypothetical protein
VLWCGDRTHRTWEKCKAQTYYVTNIHLRREAVFETAVGIE